MNLFYVTSRRYRITSQIFHRPNIYATLFQGFVFPITFQILIPFYSFTFTSIIINIKSKEKSSKCGLLWSIVYHCTYHYHKVFDISLLLLSHCGCHRSYQEENQLACDAHSARFSH